MKTFISRLLLLAAGILCLNCGTPTAGRNTTPERIETLRDALRGEITGKTKPITIRAAFDEAMQLIMNLKPDETGYDREKNLTFRYADKDFVLQDDGAGKEASHILHRDLQVIVVRFDPGAPDTEK